MSGINQIPGRFRLIHSDWFPATNGIWSSQSWSGPAVSDLFNPVHPLGSGVGRRSLSDFLPSFQGAIGITASRFHEH